MKAEERKEPLLKWVVLPNESYKWDFILEQLEAEDSQTEIAPDLTGTKQFPADGFDKDYVVTHKKRKNLDNFYY